MVPEITTLTITQERDDNLNMKVEGFDKSKSGLAVRVNI